MTTEEMRALTKRLNQLSMAAMASDMLYKHGTEEDKLRHQAFMDQMGKELLEMEPAVRSVVEDLNAEEPDDLQKQDMPAERASDSLGARMLHRLRTFAAKIRNS